MFVTRKRFNELVRQVNKNTATFVREIVQNEDEITALQQQLASLALKVVDMERYSDRALETLAVRVYALEASAKAK